MEKKWRKKVVLTELLQVVFINLPCHVYYRVASTREKAKNGRLIQSSLQPFYFFAEIFEKKVLNNLQKKKKT